MMNGNGASSELTPATEQEISELQDASNAFYWASHMLNQEGVKDSLIACASLFVTAQLLALNTSPQFASEQLHTMADKVLREFPSNSTGHA